MAKSQSSDKHFYFDQQHPIEEPEDAEHATVPPTMFARRVPSHEDEFFYHEGKLHSPGGKPAEKQPGNAKDEENSASPEHHARLIDRLVEALNRLTNTHWRP